MSQPSVQAGRLGPTAAAQGDTTKQANLETNWLKHVLLLFLLLSFGPRFSDVISSDITQARWRNRRGARLPAACLGWVSCWVILCYSQLVTSRSCRRCRAARSVQLLQQLMLWVRGSQHQQAPGTAPCCSGWRCCLAMWSHHALTLFGNDQQRVVWALCKVGP